MPGTSADAAADYLKNMPFGAEDRVRQQVLPDDVSALSSTDVVDSTVSFAADDAETIVDAGDAAGVVTTAQAAADFQSTQEGLQFLKTQMAALQHSVPHARTVRPAAIQKRRKADKVAKQARKRNRR